MWMELRGKTIGKLVSKVASFCCVLCLFCIFVLLARNNSCLETSSWRTMHNSEETKALVIATAGKRRKLIGPGSYPPRCTSKCGKCTPCRAVHVPVPPGAPVMMEYYPEAWRCKCGNHLYMP